MSLERKLIISISKLVKWAFSGEFSVNKIATTGGLLSQTLSTGKQKGEDWNPTLDTILGIARAHDKLTRKKGKSIDKSVTK